MPQDNSPAIRGFQLDSNAIGDAQKSVNLFRGDVNLPLKLVSLPGTNGLDLNLSAFYSGAIGQQPDTWNLSSPTGILGLGWSLGFDYIEFNSVGTASYLEGNFTAYINGRGSKLILIQWLNADESNETLEFADPTNPLWQYIYSPPKEQWQIKRDDGVTMSFGGIEDDANAVQWGVRWDNWVGSSQSASHSPTKFARAWNLRESKNQWGDTISYAYKAETQIVTGDLEYTRASYIETITDTLKRQVTFIYDDKNRVEYQPPHTDNNQPPINAYQDRYQTQYLTSIDVNSSTGDLYYSIDFDSQVISLGATAEGSTNLTNTSKRYLQQVRQHRNGRNVLPPLTFAYDLKEGSISRGRLNQITYPSGGSVNWNYEELSLGDSDIFNLDYTVKRPQDSGYESATPRLWFGPDYVVIIWYAESHSTGKLQIFQYGGYWAEKPYEIDINGFDPGTIDNLHIAFGVDFFGLYYHSTGNVSDRLFVYQKTPYQFGNWTQTIFGNITSGDAYAEESSLVAGNNFLAVRPGGRSEIHRFVVNRRTQQWCTGDIISGPSAETKIAIAAAGNILAAGFFADAGNDGDEEYVSAKNQVYYLENTHETQAIWRSGFNTPSSLGPFLWDPSYIYSYLHVGSGFVVSNYSANNNCQLNIIQWQRNYASFSTFTVEGDALDDNGLPYPTVVSGNVIANRGKLYRYDGSHWVSAQYSWPNKTVTTSDDSVIAATLDGSGFNTNLAQYDPLKNTNENWSIYALATPNPSSATPASPQFSHRFLTIGANLYFKDTDGNFNVVNNVFSDSPGNIVACHGPLYVAYEEGNAPGTSSTKVALLLNGQVDGDIVELNNQRIGNPNAIGTSLTGPSAFATYDNQYTDFRLVPEFTLHRILNRQVGGYLNDVVVSKLHINTGTQALITAFNYDPSQAVFDDSGQVAQYPEVTSQRQDSAENNLGSTTYTYLNGLQPEDNNSSIADCYSLAAGFLSSTTDCDDSGNTVSSTRNTWTGLTYPSTDNSGFTQLSGIKVVRTLSSTETTENLDVFSSTSNRATGETASVAKTTTMTYVDETTAVRSQSIEQYNSQGERQTRSASITYAWEVYDNLKNPVENQAPLLSSQAQTLLSLNGNPVTSTATTYSNQWNGGTTGWGVQESWQWNGEGDASFNFNQPDTTQWLKLSSVDSRNSSGLATLASNAAGLETITTYDQSGVWPIAILTNTNGSDAAFTGFENYEPENIWQGGTIQSGDSHTGSACVLLHSGDSLTSSSLTASQTQKRYLLSCFIKTPSDGNNINATVTLQAGTNANAATKNVTVTSDWQYIFVYANTADSGSLTLNTAITATGGDLLVDDVLISPVESLFSALVYDGSLMRPVARLANNGQTQQIFYDYLLRALGQSGPNNQMTNYGAHHYTSSDLNLEQGRLNSQITLSATEGGPFDDFRDPNWQRNWHSDTPEYWSVTHKILKHSGTEENSVTLKNSDVFSNIAVHVQVTQSGTSASGTFGISIGDSLNVQWNSSKNQWQLLINGAVVQQAPPANGTSAVVPTDLLLIAYEHNVVFFVDQQQTLAHALPLSEPAIKGALQLFTAADGLGFSQVLTYCSPSAAIAYSDGTGRSVQTQQLLDNSIIVNGTFYDALGRATINTKPAIYETTAWGYQPNFAHEPTASNNWQMSGYINDYYNGSNRKSNDEGYPYSRARYENSSLNRVLESGKPGRLLAIRDGNTHTTRYLYGTNAAEPFFAPALTESGQYNVNVIIDPDGLTSTSISDLLGNAIASIQGSLNNDDTVKYATVLDQLDNPQTLRTPNYYHSPSGEVSDWEQLFTYNIFNQLEQSTTNDKNTTKRIYDILGNLRFELIADGLPSAQTANPAGQQTAVRYWKYDSLSRCIEQGWVAVDHWDQQDLQNKANQDWPQNSDHWRFRYSYDGDGSQTNAQGQLCLLETQQEDGSVVTEHYQYALDGNVISVETSVPGSHEFSGTVNYQRNHAGLIKQTIIPSLNNADNLTLNYHYDLRGLVSTVFSNGNKIAEYYWDASGNPLSEILGSNTVNRNFTYTSSSQPKTIAGNFSSETFHYNDGTGTDRYNGLPSAITSQFGDLTPERTWKFAWDNYSHINSVIDDQTPSSNQSYQYDANGNVIQHNNKTFTAYPGKDQLQCIEGQPPSSYVYTPSGNITTAPDQQFNYNFNTNLTTQVTSPPDNNTLNLTYGSGAQRLVKQWNDGSAPLTRQYLPGTKGHALVEKTHTADDQISELRYVFGPLGLIAIESDASELLYVLKDHEQSTRQVIKSNKEIEAEFDYAPFGQLTQSGGANPDRIIYRYTGQEWDTETALYNYRHRLYNPTTLTFLATDPANQFFSPYLYVGDDPVLRTDPSGEFSFAGFFTSLGEVAVGVATLPMGGPESIGLIGAGIAGMGYSSKTNSEDFSWSTWAQAEVGGAIGVEEIAAGVTLTVLTDGAAGAIGGGTLIGAGFSGLTYSTLAGNDYNWKDYGIQQAVGAAAGLVTAGFGAAGGALAEGASSVARQVGIQVAAGAAGGFIGSATGQAVGMGLQGYSAGEIFSREGIFSNQNLIQDGISGAIAGVGGGLGSAVKYGSNKLLASENPLFTPAEKPANSFGNIVKLSDDAASTSTGWNIWIPGVIKRTPKLVTPLLLNQKKWF